jgi:hypothetical protein
VKQEIERPFEVGQLDRIALENGFEFHQCSARQ